MDNMASTPETTPVEASGNHMEEKLVPENRHGKRTHRTQSRSNQRGNTQGRGAPGGRNKKSDMGRAEWRRNPVDKRARNEAQAAKYRKLNEDEDQLPIYASKFSQEEIQDEGKKPKRKVAVMIGYSGSGYKGLQLNHREKTIEGDLFGAFVAAGAISKANADDPKKSSLVRCARTDKGVHAAGNLISLKLIIEDPDIVQKINEKLSPQIRVFGLTRTNGSFSAYQFCDSRIYEYLIPTHAFLPPHPRSFLGKELIELAKEAEDIEGYQTRQQEVLNFWEETEEKYIKPILEQLNPSVRQLVVEALYNTDASQLDAQDQAEIGGQSNSKSVVDSAIGRHIENSESAKAELRKSGLESPVQGQSPTNPEDTCLHLKSQILDGTSLDTIVESRGDEASDLGKRHLSALESAIKNLRITYIIARNAYRIQPERLTRVRSSLSRYLGTHNFHNYTIHKNFRDPSAKRQIRSFVVNDQPMIINGTEWLSLKVHGQSFMMHQIRKMVSMVALVVRCGCHEGRLQDTYMQDRLSIPKAPGLGLLLERPVFDAYNEKLVGEFGRESIDFSKFGKEMEEFKKREIYERIFREEDRDHPFHTFFASIDNLKSSQLLYLSSVGVPATTRSIQSDSKSSVQKHVIDGSSSEDEAAGNENDG